MVEREAEARALTLGPAAAANGWAELPFSGLHCPVHWRVSALSLKLHLQAALKQKTHWQKACM